MREAQGHGRIMGPMSFQAYLDSVKAKTGKTPRDFARLAAELGLTKHGEIVTWLKQDFALGHGHANAIAVVLLKPDPRKASPTEHLDALFAGPQVVWRDPCERLLARVREFGPDVSIDTNETYVNILRAKKFAILQPSSAVRLDIGIKRKGVAPAGRFEAAGSWNRMVTHRLRVVDPREIDAEVVAWLKLAYDGVSI